MGMGSDNYIGSGAHELPGEGALSGSGYRLSLGAPVHENNHCIGLLAGDAHGIEIERITHLKELAERLSACDGNAAQA